MNIKKLNRFLGGVILALLIFIPRSVYSKGSQQLPLPPPLSIEAAREVIRTCAPKVAVSTMSAITRHESRWRPYTIALNRATVRLSRQPENEQEAVATAKHLLSLGYNFDMGFAQINSENLKNPALMRAGINVENIFASCTNVRAAEIILVDCFTRAQVRFRKVEDALNASLSCYNTGNFSKGFSNGYVRKVYAARQ
jgi:type IV secretion system protein VirB1